MCFIFLAQSNYQLQFQNVLKIFKRSFNVTIVSKFVNIDLKQMNEWMDEKTD